LELALLEYIKDQLLFNDTVTLPGLGSFEIRKSASRIEGSKIIPPGLQVVFNTEKSLDDGSLAKNIASAEDISQDEASQKVLEYIDGILFALNKGETYVFAGFGKLFRDSENVIRFERNPAYKIDFESYGLESFELDPIEELMKEENISKQKQKDNQKEGSNDTNGSPEAKKANSVNQQPGTTVLTGAGWEPLPSGENKNNRSLFWILTGAAMVILVSLVLIKMTTGLLDGTGLSVFDSGQNKNSELFPEEETWDIESTLNGELGEIIDSMTVQENALTLKETSEPRNTTAPETGEYKEFHIIAGSFKDKENAGILQQKLTEQGYPALVIQQGDKLYRVSAISFRNKEQGLNELGRFKQKTKNNAAWLLGLQ
jgi:nucleoid DNA-binding protein